MSGFHKIRTALYTAFLLICFTAPGWAAAASVTDGNFFDEARGRTVPYKLYAPAHYNTPAPVVIFSHGLGGSVNAAPYLGEALANHGYFAFFIQHEGSDQSVWEGTKRPLQIKKKLAQSTMKPENAKNRYLDLPFVIDALTALNQMDGPLKGALDLNRIGMAGHSYGARSVMMAGGEKQIRKDNPAYKDPRIKAAIALSPNLPQHYISKKPDEAALDALYTGINIPLFHITGTEDDYPFSQNFDPLTRTLPYHHINAENQYLLVLDGADHMTFGGRKTRKSDASYQRTVADGALLFFDAYLKGDPSALQRLREDYPRTLRPDDRFTYK
ncbi:MAG: hypothetical protein H6869_01640 [Rhodospirillales bacterium]|nr:hypothetical protein [Rhodospirillales bacterium]